MNITSETPANPFRRNMTSMRYAFVRALWEGSRGLPVVRTVSPELRIHMMNAVNTIETAR